MEFLDPLCPMHSLSGTGANNLVQLTFTPTAGALVLTDTGSLANVQLEAGSFATSRIITYGAPVTRAADSLSAPNIQSLWPWLQTPTGFTIAADFSLLSGANLNTVPLIAWVSGQDNSVLAIMNNSGQITPAKYVGGVYAGGTTASLNTTGGTNTVALSVTFSGLTGSVNHGAVGNVVNAGLPKYTTLGIGSEPNGYATIAGHISAITLCAGPTPSAALQAMQ